MSKRHGKPKNSNEINNFKNANDNKSKKNSKKQKSTKSHRFHNTSVNNSEDKDALTFSHDMVELELLNDQLNACYSGLLGYLFLIKATQESIDKIVVKYEDGDVDNLPNPAKDANTSTILTFFTLLQFTRIAYYRLDQVTQQYNEGTSDIPPIFRQEIFYGLIISSVNIWDQRMRELRSPYSPVLTPFP